MNSTKLLTKFFYATTAVAFLFQLVIPTTAVFADDDVLPPSNPEVVEVDPPSGPVVDSEIVAVEPTTDPATVSEIVATDPTTDPLTISEVLEQFPTDTDVVVLDDQGAALPLASEAAAGVMVQNDPMWCETGYYPGDATHCTTSQTSVANLLTALGTMYTGSGSIGSGTIYFTSSYSGSDFYIANDSNANAGSAYDPLWDRITDLTIQGGWDGVCSSNCTFTTTTFSRAIKIIWMDNLTLKDIKYDGATDNSNPDYGLILMSTGAGKTLTLDNVEVLNTHNTNGLADGANISGTDTGSIVITDSKFSENQGDGLWIYGFGTTTLTRLDVSNNATDIGGNGASIECYSGSGCAAGTVTITDSTFNGNGSVVNSTEGKGLDVRTNGAISISGVTANGNTADGARIRNGEGTKDLTISDSTFGSTATLGSLGANPTTAQRLLAGNGAEGLIVGSKGAITLNSVTADYNKANGLNTFAEGSGTLTIGKSSSSSPASSFSHNEMDGILASSAGGAVSLNSVLATDNGYHGAELGSSNDTGNYTITGGTFSNNGSQTSNPVDLYDGLNVKTSGNINIDGITANGNSQNGAYLNTNNGNASNTGTITVANSTFGAATSIFDDPTNKDADPRKWGNGHTGLEIVSGGLASLNTVTANYNGSAWQNGGNGIDVQNIATGGINLTSVTANNNYGNGTGLSSPNDLDVTGSTFNYNGDFGAFTDIGGDQDFTTTNANYNGLSGLHLDATNYQSLPGFPSPTGDVTLKSVTTHDNGLNPKFPAPGIGFNSTVLSGSFACSSVNSYANGEDDTYICASGGSSGGDSSGGGSSGGGEAFSDDGLFTGISSSIRNISMGDGQNVDLSCGTGLSGFNLNWSDNQVFLPCSSIGGEQSNSVMITIKSNSDLPAPFESRYTFITGMDVKVASPLTGDMVVSFTIPSGMSGSSFIVLFWDGSKWVEISGYQTADDLFSVNTTQAGLYVLVTK